MRSIDASLWSANHANSLVPALLISRLMSNPDAACATASRPSAVVRSARHDAAGEARPLDRLRGGRQARRVAADEQQHRALRRDRLRDGGADAAAAAGEDREVRGAGHGTALRAHAAFLIATASKRGRPRKMSP